LQSFFVADERRSKGNRVPKPNTRKQKNTQQISYSLCALTFSHCTLHQSNSFLC
jgi:hypothetical protein